MTKAEVIETAAVANVNKRDAVNFILLGQGMFSFSFFWNWRQNTLYNTACVWMMMGRRGDLQKRQSMVQEKEEDRVVFLVNNTENTCLLAQRWCFHHYVVLHVMTPPPPPCLLSLFLGASALVADDTARDLACARERIFLILIVIFCVYLCDDRTHHHSLHVIRDAYVLRATKSISLDWRVLSRTGAHSSIMCHNWYDTCQYCTIGYYTKEYFYCCPFSSSCPFERTKCNALVPVVHECRSLIYLISSLIS